MPSLSLKNVPEPIVERLRRRAAANHRSLQGELMAVVTAAAEAAEPGKPTIREILEQSRRSGFRSASTSVQYVREDRDAEDR